MSRRKQSKPRQIKQPRTQDSRGGPEDEDRDGEEQGPTHSGDEEEEEGEEEEEELQWRGPVSFRVCCVVLLFPLNMRCECDRPGENLFKS
ncbi:zinc finger protein ZFPM1 isoform X4 [Siniperca chuatsi]|uniref:zinc finger protein ZFPM1 isoform X4 n=1 Tax=Siniperca chuatsi TaxID=119488 RepID=UPI001CE04B85|nr:zinc finger protein ZFPM1 isoform X4 [Siniperca chuatsi]